jgi:membrane protease YdiL (CAAX protease family)
MSSTQPSLPAPQPLSTRPELPEGIVRPDPPPPARRAGADGLELPRWPLWAPFAAMLLTLGVALVGVVAITVIAELAGVSVVADDPPPGVQVGGTYIQDLALIGSALVLARMCGGPPTPAQFGLVRTRVWPAIGWTLLIWLGFVLFSGVWSALVGIDETDDLPQRLGADDSTVILVFVAVLVCVLAPIAEELFFRGFLFTAVRRSIGVWPAAVVTGLVFGGIHAGGTKVEFLVPLAVLGFGLCAIYWLTRSLLPCIVLHAINNGIALGVAMEWSALGVAATVAGATAVVLAISLPVARGRAPAERALARAG